ncbi:MAG TPA: hydroxyacylglutathione hydrolase [Kofleriaceae bacterium]|nr:hydroxyacylglutathione hydrolase [Kofleriaceae bacterium]
MRIVPVPCLKDNYAYLVIEGEHAAVVDPGEAKPMLDAAEREGVTIEQIWCTHHHPDHVGGVRALVDHGISAVIAHAHDKSRIDHVSRAVEDGDTVELHGRRARVLHNPGHTLGAISFYFEDCGAEPGAVFTGDTLFSAGCGRLFEGTAAMMHASLVKLASLPADVRVFFGHEYTEANLRFAVVVEPDNHAIPARVRDVSALRARGEASTPSTVGIERETNPFVRAPDAETFAALRARKDTFR